MPGAGELSERVWFSREAVDADGRRLGEFERQFSRAAKITYLKGTEPVMQARLQGVQPVVVTIRASLEARAIDSSWRIEHPRLGALFNVTGVAPTMDRAFLDILAQSEGANPP